MLDSLVDLQLHVSGWIVPIPDNLGGGGGTTSANQLIGEVVQSRRRPLLGAFNQENALVGAFSVIVQYNFTD